MSNEKVKILITGDAYLGGGRVREPAVQNNVNKLFGDFKDNIADADLAITNLESPLIDDGKPIDKTGPALKSPIAAIDVLKTAGFNLLTLANNHIMDYGISGLNSTMDTCKEYGISYTGVGHSMEEAAEPFMTEINGIKFAVINIAENEFGTIKDIGSGGNPLDAVQNYYEIRKTKKNVDYLILIVHGGHEGYNLPSPRIEKTYRFFADAGADIIVGHHPHCYSGYEIYNETPIFYSLGNFLFDQLNNNVNTSWHEGFILQLYISKNIFDFEIMPYIQNGEQAGLRKLTEKELSKFNLTINKLNTIIEDDKNLKVEFENFCLEKSNLYNSYLEPHSNRFLHVLQNRNLLPSFISAFKRRLLLNLIRCEAHRDVLLEILQK